MKTRIALVLPLRILPRRSLPRDYTRTLGAQQMQSTPLSTSTQRPASVSEQTSIQAAPEIDLSGGGPIDAKSQPKKIEMSQLRVVPASASYFSGRPTFTDDLLTLQTILRKYQTLPLCQPEEIPPTAWIDYLVYRNSIGGEPVKASRYSELVKTLKRLNAIHPAVMPEEVDHAMGKFKKDVDPNLSGARPIVMDEYGRTRGIGRRKTSSAEVWLVEGDGEVLVNGKPLNQAFTRVHDRESVIWSLKSTERLDKYNVWALVKGGGSTGQAEALTLGITKALLAHEPLLKKPLRQAGVVTRDPRRVERKKPGKAKARKMPAWVKR